MAACLHVLARQLYSDFFKPCYIPSFPVCDDEIQEILAQQLLTDVKKERITRALLLSTYGPEEVDEAIEQAVYTTSKEVLERLHPIGGNEAFRKEVEALFRDAAVVWKEVQHSRKAVEVRMPDEFHNNGQWPHLDEFTVAGIKGQPGPPKFGMLNLFPRMFVHEDRHVVNPGCVLLPHQNTVFAAEQEFRETIATKRSRGGSMRQRRPSTLPDGRYGATGSSPTSQPTDDKAFLVQAQRGAKQGNQIQNGPRGDG